MKIPSTWTDGRRPPESHGGVILDDQQREWYLEKYGIRYVGIPENPVRPSRNMRRGRARNQSDVDLWRIQQDAIKQLRGAHVRPA